MTPTTSEQHLYEYAVIRYVPSVEREEFVNIGLIMMCKRRKWLRVRLHLDSGRLTSFRAPHTEEEILRQLDTFVRIGEGNPQGGPIALLTAEERFRWLTAVKSASIATSRPHPGKTADLEATFDRLFGTLVL